MNSNRISKTTNPSISQRISLPKEIFILLLYQMGWYAVGVFLLGFFKFPFSWKTAFLLDAFFTLMGSRSYAVYRRKKHPVFFTRSNQFWLALYDSGIYAALQGILFFWMNKQNQPSLSFWKGFVFLLLSIPISWLCTFVINTFCLRFQLPTFVPKDQTVPKPSI